jgi:ribosomal protein S18 acetylase RimI-like enzyme
LITPVNYAVTSIACVESMASTRELSGQANALAASQADIRGIPALGLLALVLVSQAGCSTIRVPDSSLSGDFMGPPEVVTATEADRQRVIQSVVLGFAADPLTRWFWPDALAYQASGQLYDAFGGRSIDSGTTFATANCEGVALWMPPGVEPDEERMIPLLESTVPADRLEDAFGVFEAMASYHPEETCWYLPLIAVDPIYQGFGFGSHLMKHALLKIDSEGLPAYLESSNPRNISLYERHGFEVMGEIQVGGSPTVTPMIRQAR